MNGFLSLATKGWPDLPKHQLLQQSVCRGHAVVNGVILMQAEKHGCWQIQREMHHHWTGYVDEHRPGYLRQGNPRDAAIFVVQRFLKTIDPH